MWRANKFTENEDSDLSMSDEADYGDDLRGDCISLGRTSEKKGEVQVLSQLEMLKDGREHVRETNHTIFAQKRLTNICVEDGIEFPSFANEDHFLCLPRGDAASCNSDDEIISDDEVQENNVHSTKFITSGVENYQKVGLSNSGSTRDAETCTWSVANREAEALFRLNENAGRYSSRPVTAKGNISLKGGKGKGKPKFSFHSHSHKEDLSWDVNDVNKSRISFKEENIEDLEIQAVTAELAIRHDSTRHSMVELLGCFQDKNALPQGTKKQTKRKGAQLALKKNVPLLGNRNIDDDPEGLDSGSSNDDDEDKHRNLKLIIPESKRITMLDQFQEALGVASTIDEGHQIVLPNSSIGLFGKLQQVMQREKERDVDFSNCLLMEGKCIDVKILSRCLEAKLTVCLCSCIGDSEGSKSVDNHHMVNEIGRTLTIIFSSRMCSDVELEVGNLIRIHPPWREVRVMGKDDSTILSTYFSQI